MNFKDWLNLRFEADAEARNKDLEQQALATVVPSEIVVVDVGAGTGSNLRYYSKVLPQVRQHWKLLDLEFDLLETTLQNIQDDGGKVQRLGHGRYLLDLHGKEIQVELMPCDIFSDKTSALLNQADLVVSNAFFDLPSEQNIEVLLSWMDFSRQVLLATINYTGMHFLEESTNDAYWIAQYEKHMRRSHGVGPDCVDSMRHILSQRGLSCSVEPSDWRLNSNHPLRKGIFDFMEEAFRDLSLNLEEFHLWATSKLDSELIVSHSDVLVLPQRETGIN